MAGGGQDEGAHGLRTNREKSRVAEAGAREAEFIVSDIRKGHTPQPLMIIPFSMRMPNGKERRIMLKPPFAEGFSRISLGQASNCLAYKG